MSKWESSLSNSYLLLYSSHVKFKSSIQEARFVLWHFTFFPIAFLNLLLRHKNIKQRNKIFEKL